MNKKLRSFTAIFAVLALHLFGTTASAQRSTFYGRYPDSCITDNSATNLVYAGNETFYLGGTIYGTNQFVLMKTNGNGVPLWEKGYKMDTGVVAQKLLLMSNGDLVIVGGIGNIVGFFRADKNGNFKHAKGITTTGAFTTLASAATNDGGFIITGSGCPGENPVIRIDSSGNIGWAKTFTGATKNICDIYSPDGNTFSLMSLNKLSNLGLISLSNIDKGGNSYASPVFDAGTTGNTLLGGSISRSRADSTKFFCVYGTQSIQNTAYLMYTTAAGVVSWSKKLTLINPTTYPGYGMTGASSPIATATADGGVIVAQTFLSPVDSAPRNLFTRFDNAGNILWSQQSTNATVPTGWTTEGQPISGTYHKQDSTIIYIAWNTTNTAIYRLRENGNGLCVNNTYSISATTMPLTVTTVTPTPAAMTVSLIPHSCLQTKTINNYITYYCKDTTTSMPATTLTHTMDINTISVYPNPATNEITIENAGTGTAVEIFTVTGMKVYSGITNSDKTTINTAPFAPTVYLMQFTDVNGNRSVKRVVKQ